MNAIALIALIIWTALFMSFLFVKLRNKDTSTTTGYALAGRELNTFQIALSIIATFIGGGTLIAFSGQITKFGYAFIFAPVGVFIAFLLLSWFSTQYRRENSNPNTQTTVSIIQRLINAFGPRIKVPSLFVMLLTLLSFISIQLYGGALLLSEILEFNFMGAAILLALITGIYSTLAGSRGDVLSDIFQGFLILIVIISGVFFLFDSNPHKILLEKLGSSSELLDVFNQGLPFLIAMLVLPVFSIHTDPSIQFKLYMAKSDKAARQGPILAAILYFVFMVSLIFMVLGIHANYGFTGDKVLIQYALQGNLFTLIGLTLAIYAAVISTMDSQAINASTIIVNDVFKTFEPKLNDDKEQARYIKKLLPFIFFISLIITFILYNIKSAFFLLSTIWVTSISSFGLIFLSLGIPRLKQILIKFPKILSFDIGFSAILIILIALFLILKNNENPSTIMLGIGVLTVVLKLVFYIVLNFINKIKN